MDTSKKYYEDKIRDFNRYRRGRTLAQFCKDEGIDYVFPHHDFTGYELYIKWFDDGKFLKPVFNTIRKRHTITRSQLLLFLTGAVQTKHNTSPLPSCTCLRRAAR